MKMLNKLIATIRQTVRAQAETGRYRWHEQLENIYIAHDRIKYGLDDRLTRENDNGIGEIHSPE